MTTCLEKSCSFGSPCVFFVNVYQCACVRACVCVCVSFVFCFEGGMWDLSVLVLDHCLYFALP